MENLGKKFTDYFQHAVFGLTARVDDPKPEERLPIASAILVIISDCPILLTAAHFMKDVKRWHEEKRLRKLSLFLLANTGQVEFIEIDLFGQFLKLADFGFYVLSENVIAQLQKKGGKAISIEKVDDPHEMHALIIFGNASAYTKFSRETIAKSETQEWELFHAAYFAMILSALRYEGDGPDPLTYKFAILDPHDDYSGMSGGPIFGYKKGSQIRDYSLVALQSSQIRVEGQKPTHLIGVAAPAIIPLIEAFIEEERKRGEQT